jgi:hypothetical protein
VRPHRPPAPARAPRPHSKPTLDADLHAEAGPPKPAPFMHHVRVETPAARARASTSTCSRARAFTACPCSPAHGPRTQPRASGRASCLPCTSERPSPIESSRAMGGGVHVPLTEHLPPQRAGPAGRVACITGGLFCTCFQAPGTGLDYGGSGAARAAASCGRAGRPVTGWFARLASAHRPEFPIVRLRWSTWRTPHDRRRPR